MGFSAAVGLASLPNLAEAASIPVSTVFLPFYCGVFALFTVIYTDINGGISRIWAAERVNIFTQPTFISQLLLFLLTSGAYSFPMMEPRFSGWQYQPSIPTVQCILEQALTQITKLERKDLHLVGAGRTDAGVHALGQVAHFITPFNYDTLDGIHKALNGLLPKDIRVREIGPAAPEFHARFSVVSKIYEYKIYNDAIMDPFQRLYAYHSIYKLNADAIRDAAKHFIGKHDFSAFANAARNERGPLLQLEVEGSGFLYRQVRNMVALLLQVGREAVPPDLVPKILESRDRKQLAKYTLSVPPHGLCLKAISYKEEHLHLPVGSPVTSFGMHHSIRTCKLPCF